MPNPTRGDVHVNAPLTNISLAYAQDATNFIADRAFPTVPVAKQSDRYFYYDRGDFNRDDMKERAPGTESAGGGYNIDSTPTYYAPVFALHKDVDDQIRANSDSPLNADRDATVYLTNKALIKRERTFAASAMTTGVWGTDVAGVAAAPGAGQFLQWNDVASDPVGDIRKAITAVLGATGFEPNKLILSTPVMNALVDHPDIVDRVKYGQTSGGPAIVNEAAIAALFGLKEVLVSKAVYNSANEGAAEASTFVAGKSALLSYVADAPGIMTPSAGYTFSWNGWMGATNMGHRVKRFRMDELEADRVEIQMAYDQKVVGSELGYFFGTAVA